jgi:hypothetical protein
VVGLVIGGLIGTVLVLYAADHILKARGQARKKRRMSARLAAAAVRAEKQQEQREAAAEASAALTTFMPAIQHPPLSVPGVRPHRAARTGSGHEQTGPHERRAAPPGRRSSRTGDHPARPAGR